MESCNFFCASKPFHFLPTYLALHGRVKWIGNWICKSINHYTWIFPLEFLSSWMLPTSATCIWIAFKQELNIVGLPLLGSQASRMCLQLLLDFNGIIVKSLKWPAISSDFSLIGLKSNGNAWTFGMRGHVVSKCCNQSCPVPGDKGLIFLNCLWHQSWDRGALVHHTDAPREETVRQFHLAQRLNRGGDPKDKTLT